tara:strand:+ start:186 stop:323 length:138 start_codon:yes stop_codon:yes gene_type:complete
LLDQNNFLQIQRAERAQHPLNLQILLERLSTNQQVNASAKSYLYK